MLTFKFEYTGIGGRIRNTAVLKKKKSGIFSYQNIGKINVLLYFKKVKNC